MSERIRITALTPGRCLDRQGCLDMGLFYPGNTVISHPLFGTQQVRALESIDLHINGLDFKYTYSNSEFHILAPDRNGICHIYRIEGPIKNIFDPEVDIIFFKYDD